MEASAFAQVAVLAQLGRAGGLYTYGVPADLTPTLMVGSLVRVPFTSRQLQAVVCSLDDSTELPRVRFIAEILDSESVVTPHGLQLARWISKYYAAPISDVIGAMLPPGLGRDTVYTLELGAESNGHRISPGQRQLIQLVRATQGITVNQVVETFPGLDVDRDVRSLVQRGLLLRRSQLAPPRVSRRLVKRVAIAPNGMTALQTGDALKRAPRRKAVLQFVAEHGPISVSSLVHALPGSSAVVTALAKRDLVDVVEEQEFRSPVDASRYEQTRSLHLSGAQARAMSTIAASIRGRGPHAFLLHGVTGSGKTEVYLQAIAETIRRGRQAIMMVPEISLTPQAVERVAGRFPGRVAVLHSKLSPGERVDEWQRIRHGEVDVVVGPRSAIFAPLPSPGLIVVDEEHDPSYKQEVSPRYNARDAAMVLGRFTGATVILGSATPDAGTFFAAGENRVGLLELPDRPQWGETAATPRPMPAVEVVDLRQELKSGNRSIFSASLLDALHDTLSKGHQALLFLNRRGTATAVLCRDCGFVLRCPSCDIPYTYHAAAVRLICHRCDRRAASPRTCPSCHSTRIRYLGIGTQRVEEETRRVLPLARILRWDRDVTGGKEAHDRILQTFARHEADVLVGTQMIAKGLDFPLVTLVGVISADTGLHMPDFRAPERSFQLLTQVAGRAGRSSLPSRVIVQTYTPDHYAISAAKDHDYHRFYREEMTFRQAARYPPFARLTRVVYAAEEVDACRQSAHALHDDLRRAIESENLSTVDIIGPAPCYVAKIKNRYLWQIILRCSGSDAARTLHGLLDYVPAGWTIDVDPVDLL